MVHSKPKDDQPVAADGDRVLEGVEPPTTEELREAKHGNG